MYNKVNLKTIYDSIFKNENNNNNTQQCTTEVSANSLV